MSYGATVQKAISAYAKSAEYGFDELPPYDVTITKEGSGLDTKYDVLASRKDSPLTEEEEKLVADTVTSLEDMIEAMKEKEKKEALGEIEEGTENDSEPTDEEVKDQELADSM